MASGMRHVCQGRLGPSSPSMPLNDSQESAALTSVPAEFRQVMGCPVAQAIDCHPMSEISILFSPQNPQGPECGLYLSLDGRS